MVGNESRWMVRWGVTGALLAGLILPVQAENHLLRYKFQPGETATINLEVKVQGTRTTGERERAEQRTDQITFIRKVEQVASDGVAQMSMNVTHWSSEGDVMGEAFKSDFTPQRHVINDKVVWDSSTSTEAENPMRSFMGKPVKMKITPQGEVRDVGQAAGSAPPDLDMASQLAKGQITFPTQEVAVGQSWEQDSTLTLPNSQSQLPAHTKYTLAGKESVNGVECLVISTALDATAQGVKLDLAGPGGAAPTPPPGAKQAPPRSIPATINYTQKSSGKIYFDPVKGRTIKSISEGVLTLDGVMSTPIGEIAMKQNQKTQETRTFEYAR